MKRTPTVQFVIDTTPATAARLEEILEAVDLGSEGDAK
jgi:ribosome-binding factor A